MLYTPLLPPTKSRSQSVTKTLLAFSAFAVLIFYVIYNSETVEAEIAEVSSKVPETVDDKYFRCAGSVGTLDKALKDAQIDAKANKVYNNCYKFGCGTVENCKKPILLGKDKAHKAYELLAEKRH